MIKRAQNYQSFHSCLGYLPIRLSDVGKCDPERLELELRITAVAPFRKHAHGTEKAEATPLLLTYPIFCLY